MINGKYASCFPHFIFSGQFHEMHLIQSRNLVHRVSASFTFFFSSDGGDGRPQNWSVKWSTFWSAPNMAVFVKCVSFSRRMEDGVCNNLWNRCSDLQKSITNCDRHNEVANKLRKKCKTLRVYEITALFGFAKKRWLWKWRMPSRKTIKSVISKTT